MFMIKSTSQLCAIAFCLLAVSTVASASGPAATLHVERGSVMTSQGGEFATAKSGQALAAGERLMLGEDSAAAVAYPNGCQREFSAPGVYVVEADCQKAAAVDWGGAATVATGVAVGAAVLKSMDQTDPPPVSR
jgi:hypothetical protein